jgi:hypothetical protein
VPDRLAYRFTITSITGDTPGESQDDNGTGSGYGVAEPGSSILRANSLPVHLLRCTSPCTPKVRAQKITRHGISPVGGRAATEGTPRV